MRYNKQAMIVAPQPEPTEAGADVLREGGNAVDAGIACALVQGVVDPLMCGIAGLRQLRHLHAGQEVPRLYRRPCPGAARRAARHVGQPDRGRGARRLRLHPEGPGQRHRLQVDLRAGQSQDVLRGAQGARQACRGRASSSRPSPGPRAAGPCGRTFTTGGPTMAPSAARPNHERTSFTTAARDLYCRADGTPKRVGDRVVNRDYGQTLRAIAKGGADVFYTGEIAAGDRRGHEEERRAAVGRRPQGLEAGAQCAAVGRLSRLPGLDQPAAGRRRDAARDAEHPGELRPPRPRARLGRVSAHREPKP